MKSRSKFVVSLRSGSINLLEKRTVPGTMDPDVRVEAATDARLSVKRDGQGRIALSMSGKGMWATVSLSQQDARRLFKSFMSLEDPKPDPDVQTVFFPRKVPYGVKA